MTTQREQFNTLKEQGNDKFKQGDFEQAAQLYSKAISIKDDEPVAYSNRAQCYIKLNRYYDALADCDRALSIDSKFAKSVYRRAIANKNLHRYRSALEDLKRLTGLDPEFAGAKAEIDLIEQLIENDSRVTIKMFDKPAQYRSDTPMRKLKFNALSGEKLYSSMEQLE